MSLFDRKFFSTAMLFTLIISVGIFSLWAVSVINEDASKSFAKQQEELIKFEEMQERYKKDNYGGVTPEETLKLFVEALKAGDTALASKYFVIEKQEEMKLVLAEIKSRNELVALTKKLSATNFDMKEFFGKWKIEDIK